MTSLKPPIDADIVPLQDPAHDPGNSPAHMDADNVNKSERNGSSGNAGDKMKAVHYEGPFKVSVKEVELPKIQHPDDVIIKVTTAGTILPMLSLNDIADSIL
jgi:hypothetical protein